MHRADGVDRFDDQREALVDGGVPAFAFVGTLGGASRHAADGIFVVDADPLGHCPGSRHRTRKQ